MDRVPLDFVMTLRDLRTTGVDFTERIELVGGESGGACAAACDIARLRLAAKAGQLRSSTDNLNDPADARRFVAKMLDVNEAFEAQSVASSLVGLTFVTTYQRSADRG